MSKLSRRDLMKAGVSGAAVVPFAYTTGYAQEAPPQQQEEAAAQQPTRPPLFFFNDEEAQFVEAAIDRLIPADEWAGAKEAGVLFYIDRQLAGAYGVGARMYLEGPWRPDAPPQQGYQLRHSPADLYRIGIREARDYVRGRFNDSELWELSPEDMDSVLSALESGEAELASIPSPVFFETLLANTIEGYFSDPVHGGNRDMVSWRMVGFPGAYAQYVDLVDQHGYVFERPPIGITGLEALGHHEHASAPEE